MHRHSGAEASVSRAAGAGADAESGRPAVTRSTAIPADRAGGGEPHGRTGKDSAGKAPADNPIMALVQRAQDGDAEAFGRLYDHYADMVYRYVYSRVGGRATAEDLTSETFLRALRRIDTFTWQGRDFGAWLVTIARNLVVDHFKSSRVRLEVSTGDMPDPDQVWPSCEDSVLESLSHRALLEVVRRLNVQQQQCIMLRFLHGLTVAETARIMGKSGPSVSRLQQRAVRTLARLLTAGEGSDHRRAGPCRPGLFVESDPAGAGRSSRQLCRSPRLRRERVHRH